MTQVSDKGFKVAIITVYQEVRVNYFETNGKTESLGKETEDMKKNKMKFLELKIQ